MNASCCSVLVLLFEQARRTGAGFRGRHISALFGLTRVGLSPIHKSRMCEAIAELDFDEKLKLLNRLGLIQPGARLPRYSDFRSATADDIFALRFSREIRWL